mgnify:CR=1 FL=1
MPLTTRKKNINNIKKNHLISMKNDSFKNNKDSNNGKEKILDILYFIFKTSSTF